MSTAPHSVTLPDVDVDVVSRHRVVEDQGIEDRRFGHRIRPVVGPDRARAHLVVDGAHARDSPGGAHRFPRWSKFTTLPRSTTSPSSHSTAISATSTSGAPASACMTRLPSARSDNDSSVRRSRRAARRRARPCHNRGVSRRTAQGPRRPRHPLRARLPTPLTQRAWIRPASFGQNGAGGRLGIADPDADVSFGYICNSMHSIGPDGDPR
jgi:hypothetical protein